MPLIIIIVSLIALKYFEIGPFAGISWWWIAGLMAVAFIWFEFLERMLGLDKRRAHDEFEKNQQERVKKTFDKHKRPGR
jgi:small Trp-rich protein